MLVLFLLPVAASAQDYAVRMGDKAYENLAYSNAIERYTEALEYGADTAACRTKLAESYLNVRDFRNAATWYAKVCAVNTARPVDAYNYAQCLRATGQFAQADTWMSNYREMAEADGRSQRQQGSVRYAANLLATPIAGCTVRNVDANCTNADMGAAYLGDRLVFASARTTRSSEQRNHTWNGDPFLDLYSGKIGADAQLTDVLPLKDLNTRYHESNATFTRDRQEIWFTRNNYSKGKKGTTAQGVVNLKIYARTRTGDSWGDERPFPHNTDVYSVGHPSLTADGQRMYFTSDRPGGVGGTDIWWCERQGKSEWGAPVNAGNEVNTEGDEMFPFIAADGTLYFSSEGQAGLGGFDLFAAKAVGGAFGSVSNLGTPLNSPKDDFALLMDSTGLKGYFTSDRSGGMGNDDLYSFTLLAPFGRSLRVVGQATDAATKLPLANASIALRTNGNDVLATTGPDGRYAFDVEPGTAYELVGTATDFVPANATLAPLPDRDTTAVRDLLFAKDGKVSLLYHVKNAFTGGALPGVTIDRLNLLGLDQIEKAINRLTDPEGNIRETLEGAQIGDSIVMYIELKKEGFRTKKGTFRYKITEWGEIDVHKYMDLCLFPLEHDEFKLTCMDNLDHSGLPLAVGRDVREMIDINPIYFDLNKFNIRPDAAAELDKIVGVMNAYPQMHIELGSHTDARGSDASNTTLSDNRAKSSAAYIVSKGIAQERISGKGYGETRLENKCKNGVKCTEAEHQINRRTEFIIVKM